MRYLLILALALPTWAAPIPGWQPGINHTGFDTGGVVYVPIAGGKMKQEQVDLVNTILPRGGRDMDLLQVVTNDTTTWATRSGNDLSAKGITYETDVRVANQFGAGYVPWINSPLMADEDHDFKLGQLWGESTVARTIRFSKGNEVWNVFAGNLGDWNLQRARAEGYSGASDFEKLSRRQGDRLARASKQFLAGARSKGWTGTVITEVEGFAPITAYAEYQLDEMRKRGTEPSSINARVAIGQYAAGSDTDIANGSTPREKADAVIAFITNSLVPWTNSHRDLARRYTLTDVVDAYELRVGQRPNGTGWIPFQYTPEQREVQERGMRLLVNASGVDAMLNVEGVYGFPWQDGIGQFPLIDLNRDTTSQAYQGMLGLIDHGTVPEPTSGWIVALVGALLARRPRKSGLAKS